MAMAMIRVMAMAIEMRSVSPFYLLLAGGQSRRMGGGDKNLMMLGGKPLLSHVIGRAVPANAPLVINANGDPGRFAAFGLPVVADVVDGFAGPLAGVLTGLEAAVAHGDDITHVISLATDAPFLPTDLSARLCDAVTAGAQIAQARSSGRRHPVFAIWPVALAPVLRAALLEEGIRKIDDFTVRYDCAVVDFDGTPDPFTNVNTPDDLAMAESMLAG